MPPRPSLHLLRSTESGIVLQLITPSYEVMTETLPGAILHRLTASGYAATLEPGKPQVPLMGTLLGVPPDARVELRILADDIVPLPGCFDLLPAPRPAPLTSDLQPGEFTYEPDPAAYASDALYPPVPAHIADDAWLRDQRIVRVELYPFQVNPVRGALLWHRRLRVEVRFAGTRSRPGPQGAGSEYKAPSGLGVHRGGVSDSPQGFATEPDGARAPHRFSLGRSSVGDGPFEPVLRHSLLNYETAKAWRGQPAWSADQKPGFSATVPRYKIIVDRDAFYRLTYTDLQAAGMDVEAVDPRTFHLTSQGQDVAVYVAGEDDGRFDPDDFILFYGQKFRGAILAERYADEMAPWLALCPRCRLAGMLEKYTDENVYWLTVGDVPGPRMAATDGRPTDTAPVPAFYRATVHAEESHEWYTHHFTSEDTWFWDRIRSEYDPVAQTYPPVTRTYTTALTALASGPFTATIRGEVVARSSNSGHHTQFYLNDDPQPLDDVYWSGKTNHPFEAQVSQSRLLDDMNRLDLVVLYNGAIEDLYFNWFEIEYARRFQAGGDQLFFPGEESGVWQYEIDGFTVPEIQVYDVTDPLAPQRVLNPRISPAGGHIARAAGGTSEVVRTSSPKTSEVYRLAFEATHDAGARYLAVAAPAVQRPKAITRYLPPDLRSPDNGADYIIITHRQFYADVQRLAEYRVSQGMRVKVVDVEDLYNEFNDGIYHPIAIKNFLIYAYANWQPPAPSYVLLVGDGHWNLKGYGVERYGPPDPILMPPNLAWVDPWQGEVDSANLLAAIVGDDILPDLYIGRLPVNSVEELIAAIAKTIVYEQAGPHDWQRHALFVADNVPDDAGDFVALSEDVITNHLPTSFQADRIYLNDYLRDGCPPSCSAVNAAIIEDLNHRGALLVNYIGHASVDRWAHEQIFVNADIPTLANGDQLPVILSMTCLDGYWIYPNRPSLVEELVRAKGKGAVGTFSPTGLGVATGHHVLQRRFYDAVFQDGVRELGPATLAAKLALYATGGNYDLIHTFTVFGDPALRLQLLPSKVYLPVVQK